MLKIALVNMPFADWNRPSFALSQLAAVARREFDGDIDIHTCYLNQELAITTGSEIFQDIARETIHLLSGVGDWLFRDLAFQEPSNTERYFKRYYREPRWAEFKNSILHIRDGLESWCHEMIDRYSLDQVDVVGFTSMFAQTVPSIALARLIKERNPAVIAVCGGANCETPMGGVIAENVSIFDFVFSGPSLQTFPELLRYLADGDLEAAKKIRGVLSSKNLGQPSFKSSVGAERDIDDFIAPDYSDFLATFERYRSFLDPKETVPAILYFETSRGCWWGERSHCTFCGLNSGSMNYRTMSAPNAEDQFQTLFSLAPAYTNYHCTDNVMPKSYPKTVFPHLSPPQDSSIFYEVKLPISEKDIESMSKAHVNLVQPGIEALSSDTLKLMGKGTTVFQNIQFLKYCVRYNIEPFWNLLIGFPGEAEEVYKKYTKDIPMLSHFPPPSGVYLIRFDRYSPYFTKSEEFGLDLVPLDFYALTYPFTAGDCRDFAYYFQDLNASTYLINASKWHPSLAELVSDWSRHWDTAAGEQPQLALTRHPDGTATVIDTRGPGSRNIDLDAQSAAIVCRLTSPMQEDRIAVELGLRPDFLAARLRHLRESGLVFAENDRLLSLTIES